MKITDIRINNMTRPLGIDEAPRLSWKLDSERKNILQTAYRVVIGEWDSGLIKSRQSIGVLLTGFAPKPCTVYPVHVIAQNNYGEEAAGDTFFETGLLSKTAKEWPARWITHSFSADDTACPIFLKHLEMPAGKKLLRARAYVTALGVYELSIDGEKIGDAFLAPGWTAYEKRLQYQTYDITKALSKEDREAEIEITAGNGWYKGFLNGDGKNCWYKDRIAVSAFIRLAFDDDTIYALGTDTDWMVRKSGILYSELYHGETQAPGTCSLNAPAVPSDIFTGKIPDAIIAQQCEPVRITNRFPAVKKLITPKGEVVIDFGQNIAGFIEVRLPLPLSKDPCTLIIRHAETLDKDGNFYTDNLRTAKATDRYLYGPKEAGMVVHPHFTYHGFRYISVEGAGKDVDLSLFTACALHTDMRFGGAFHCSNPLIEQLQRNILWSLRDNFVDIPTDCPQRDERLGWTGDAQIFAPTAVLNADAQCFYQKWMRDLMAETDPETGVPQIVPQFEGKSIGTSVWGDAATVIPWTVYMAYGDPQILKEQYPNMRLWVDWITAHCEKNHLWMNGFQRGDWLSLDGDESLHTMYGGTDRNLVANCCYARSLEIVRDAAIVLKKEDDAASYNSLYKKVRAAINSEYVTSTGRLVSETQTACVLLLYFRLLDKQYIPRVQKTLADNLALHQGHLTTGFIGTAFLLPALSQNGMQHQAEDILLTEDYPGWLYAVKRGATTIWERWNSIRPDGTFDTSGMNSLNHYSYGSVGRWLFEYAGGITPLEPGYRVIKIAPVLTRTLEEVTASIDSPCGRIVCHTVCRGGQISMDVTIPANAKARIYLPGKKDSEKYPDMIETGSGTYHFVYDTDISLAKLKYSMNAKIGDLLDDPAGHAAMERFMPGTADGPMAGFLREKTISDLAAMAPQQKPVLEKILKAANGQL